MISKKLFSIGVFIILFLGTNVLNTLGWRGDSLFWVINPATYIFVFAILFRLIEKKKRTKIGTSKGLLLTFVCYVTICIIIGRKGFFSFPVNTLLLPFLLCYMQEDHDEKDGELYLRLILLSYVMTCFIAIFERATLTNIFSLVMADEEFLFEEEEGFRSTALHNHPLTNALFITTIFLFVLVSKMKIKYKTIFFMLGYIAILCFNTRSSMILWPVAYGFYYLKEQLIMHRFNFIKISLFLSVLVIGFIFIITKFGLGDRLFDAEELMDNSANVRVDVWEMFLSMNFVQLFFSFGLSPQEIELLMYNFRIQIIENSFVIFVLNYGGVFFLMLLVSYYHILRHDYMKKYSLFQFVFCLFLYLILGNTNNGIGDYTLCILLLCSKNMPVSKVPNYRSTVLKKLF